MIVTLLTDFGTADFYVGAMKGALLSVNPDARIVDITHEAPAQDVRAGAFTLLAAYEAFPPGTIHVAVVDPGVGSTRRPILVATRKHFFVGPDNGLFSYVYECEPGYRIFHLTNEKYFRSKVSATFHGRDVFATVAGALTLGVRPEELGEPATGEVRLEGLTPRVTRSGVVEGSVIHVDRFGNCVTNITRREFPDETVSRGARIEIGGREIKTFRRFFAEGPVEDEEPFAIWGSAGFLEIAVNRGSAARLLNVKRGQAVLLDVDISGGA